MRQTTPPLRVCPANLAALLVSTRISPNRLRRERKARKHLLRHLPGICHGGGYDRSLPKRGEAMLFGANRRRITLKVWQDRLRHYAERDEWELAFSMRSSPAIAPTARALRARRTRLDAMTPRCPSGWR